MRWALNLVDEVENQKMFASRLTLILMLAPAAVGLQAHTALGAKRLQPSFAQDAPAAAPRTIRALSGDTLTKIAQRLGVPVNELVRLNGLGESVQLKKGMKIQVPAVSVAPNREVGVVVGKRITLTDGYSFDADEVWKDGNEIWYRKGNLSRSLQQQAVSSVKPIMKAAEPKAETTAQVATIVKPGSAPGDKQPVPIWIHLADGVRFRVDEVQETSDGVWYSRANLSVFLERERVARIERDLGNPAAPASRGSDWTSGNPMIDQLIRTNGSRFGVDPYLVFLVIEQESHFRSRAVSPKGARGLMQLMPGTARRLGVRSPFDPEENIRGGTQYLKELMAMFGGRVDLALASYNAGEGAVMKYGRSIPPYRETREYVKRISKRYGLAGREPGQESDLSVPRR